MTETTSTRKSSGGLRYLAGKSGRGRGYLQTEKIMLIGKSGTGKTELAYNLAFYYIKKYNRICYISPHAEDTIVVSFIEWCKKALLPFEHFIYNSSDKNMALPEYHDCLYIVDDYYTSTGRPQMLTTFISKLINQGRHQRNHVIYIAQAPDRIPSEWWYGFNCCIRYPDDKVFEKTQTTQQQRDDFNNNFTENGGEDWQMKTNTWTLLLFNSPHHISQIVTTLRSKMYESNYKPATINEYSAISKQGNATAAKTVTRSRLMDLIESKVD